MLVDAMRGRYRTWTRVRVNLRHVPEEERPPEEPPDDFVCPITQELMVDPVIASDGHAYERDAIERWFERKPMSPKSGVALDSQALFPCHHLRRQIREWQEAR